MPAIGYHHIHLFGPLSTSVRPTNSETPEAFVSLRLETMLLHMYSLDAINKLHDQFDALRPAAGRLRATRHRHPPQRDPRDPPPGALDFQFFAAPNATNRITPNHGAYPHFLVSFGPLNWEFHDIESYGTAFQGVHRLRDEGRKAFITSELGVELPNGLDQIALDLGRSSLAG